MPSREMTNREAYRQKALHCLRAADKVHDSGVRVVLLGLASNYMALADYVGGHEGCRAVHRGDRDRDLQGDS